MVTVSTLPVFLNLSNGQLVQVMAEVRSVKSTASRTLRSSDVMEVLSNYMCQRTAP
jgi:hypothetical protein